MTMTTAMITTTVTKLMIIKKHYVQYL